jgi:dCTP deaminase
MAMAFLGNNELEQLLTNGISDNKFIKERLQNASYELTLGDEVYTNSDNSKTILDDANSQFEIKPGQFAVLMTDEEITIPPEYIGFISLKFGFKFRGLINVSGFHVDPGFKGKLKFSVYNAGSNSIILDRNKPYFVLWISKLTSKLEVGEEYNGSHQGQNSITADDIMKIKGEIASPNNLLEKIKTLETSINTEREWRRWGLRIIIGILIAISVKMLWNWNAYNKGYTEALKEKKEKNIESDRFKDEISKEILIKVDSLIRLEKEKDTLK